ncbi:hypothetical protein [Dyadobacter sediminis]|uniref:Uncharacterized protein n=1 Tax=Dyadobacter sediminis TaxID=1493691 RepID=A0A5R9KFE8_9BACT|nr:hypothetical protein [Dyadobacter sediminis]TLU94786.1 hypothetical protein FEM55_11235 [Dyadobacter sediminis]GGB88163.1 hypothetical protein GCM10011325_14620 [Dyadobacter sediminis]
MDIKRRNFLQFASLSLTTVLAGFKLPDSGEADLDSYTKPLSVQMASGQGTYIFYVDGKKQIVDIVDEKGQLFTPAYSCEIKYLASDGETNLIVNVDQDTQQLFLVPGFSETYSEMKGKL